MSMNMSNNNEADGSYDADQQSREEWLQRWYEDVLPEIEELQRQEVLEQQFYGLTEEDWERILK